MKQLSWLCLGLLWACNPSQKTISEATKPLTPHADPKVWAQTITEAELKTHLYVYASDEFEGRETGQPGQKKAVDYIVEAYKKIGIQPLQPNNYIQKVPLEEAYLPQGKIAFSGKTFDIGNGFVGFDALQASFDQLVYVGYGIDDDQYTNYEELDVAGKIVLIKAGEPQDEQGNYILSGSKKKTKWSNPSESIGMRVENAAKHGAKAVFLIDGKNYPRFKNRFDYYKRKGGGQMDLKSTGNDGPATFYISADMAQALYADYEQSDASKILDQNIDFDVKSSNKDIDSENVAALIKGSEKPNEYIIISSHLDHIGKTADGQINNGADDDGSGTVALLEIAEAFKKAKDKGQGPKRSIIFLHVTGEEKGLLGSRYYTDVEPLVPLSETVANLNIDMIGRIDPKYKGDRNYLYLIGSDKLSTELHELSEAVNKEFCQIEFDYTYNDENDPNRFYYRSDHYNFAKNNIPIIFYFNGTHADYHAPSDTADKINYDLLENRTRLIFHTAWEISERENRLVVDKASK
jgi:hypothetical protein